ncbi:NARF domain-containing protein [Flectobacillus roseus]|uniref:Nucleotidyltransferase-Associated Rossmannoid Fold domain-containing protein n=1 Tax=Flectobacillus roseus TaxID=502259 RepID=A0ABT6Y5U2_9BACT|nr:NARF domain-containing protein [Flectobacillus roseus]MDI9858937.1 hypothetical protein [Flectobacillus roseus]
MRTKYSMLLICLVLITHIKSFSKVDSIRIQNLETKVGEIGDRKLKYINEDLERIQKKLKEAEGTIEKHDDLYQNCILFLSFLSTLGIGGWLWIKDKAKEKVEEVIRDESSTLSKISSDVKRDIDIRQKTKILIFTNGDIQDDTLKLLLRRNSFKEIFSMEFNKQIDASQYDLIIFSESVEMNKIVEFLKSSSKDVKYFYFGSSLFPDDIAKSFDYKVSSSKFPSQVIGNIMNLLKYN